MTPPLRAIPRILKASAENMIGPTAARREWTIVIVAIDPGGEVAVEYRGPHALAVLGLQTAAADAVEDLG